MKKPCSIILATFLCLSLASPAVAASGTARDAVEPLHSLGLVQGSGTNEDESINYDLDSMMTRNYGITMDGIHTIQEEII